MEVIFSFDSSFSLFLYFGASAPLGAYRFRELCDEFLSEGMEKILPGLQYALCGLGDTNYKTYLNNPTTIDKGLTAVGAKRIGEMGEGNASGTGEMSQDKVIQKWSQDILVPLAKALADETEIDTSKMQSKTIPLMMKLNPDYVSPHQGEKKSGMLPYIGLGAVLVGATAAILASR
jgi:sulfite reductase alpha subunit-like flavoprotein